METINNTHIIVGKVPNEWDKPIKSKKTNMALRNKSAIVGNNFPTKYNFFDDAFDFDGRSAVAESTLYLTKKVKIGSKSKKIRRKDVKVDAIYNALDNQCGNLQKNIERNAKKATGNANAARRIARKTQKEIF